MIKVKPLTAAQRTALAKLNPPHAKHQVPGTMQFKAAAEDSDTAELLIYGNIGDSWWDESVTAKQVVEQLRGNTAPRILVRINSYGGSVTDGIAIYNELRAQVKKGIKVDGQIDSIGASIASLIPMACDTLSMPETSQMMLHAPWGGLYFQGNAKELKEVADEYIAILTAYGAAMALAYAKKTGKPASEFEAMWAGGKDHYYTAAEAVAFGLADEVTDAESGADDDDAEARAAGLADAALQRLIARAPQAAIGALFAAARPAPGSAAAPATDKNHLTVRIDASGVEQAVARALRDNLPKNPPAAAGTEAGETKMDEEQKKAAAKAALDADKARREAIRSQFAPFVARQDLDHAAIAKLGQECEDDTDTTAEQAGVKLLALLGKGTTPTGGPRVEPGKQDETATYREGAILAVLHRKDPQAFKHDEKSKDFRGMALVDLARDCVERAGKRTRGMSRAEIAVQALQSTSEFPAILEAVVTKTLRRGYDGTSRTFVPWCRQGSLPDFKEVSRVQLSGAPNLKRVLEGAEYEFGTFSDGAEKYRVQKYGRIVAITWETIINDDLDALTKIPMAFGASAGDLESDIVYGILTANAALSDGIALFHADHGNLGTNAALIDAISLDPEVANPLAEMRSKMLLQKGLEGRYITVRPKYLMVPPGLEEAALKVTNAAIVAARGSDANVIGPSLTPVVEPRLHDADPNGWYGAAEPTTVDTIEYGYLEGHEGVFTETKQGFEVDGVQVKCRHVFGAKAIDHRGLFKNAGGNPSPYPGNE